MENQLEPPFSATWAVGKRIMIQWTKVKLVDRSGQRIGKGKIKSEHIRNAMSNIESQIIKL